MKEAGADPVDRSTHMEIQATNLALEMGCRAETEEAVVTSVCSSRKTGRMKISSVVACAWQLYSFSQQ